MKTIKMINISRRNAIALMLGTAGYIMSSGIAFAGKEQVLKRIDEITKGKGAKELDIFLDLPEIAENGNQVKVNFEIESEMTKENYIKNVYILADGNPAPDDTMRKIEKLLYIELFVTRQESTPVTRSVPGQGMTLGDLVDLSKIRSDD